MHDLPRSTVVRSVTLLLLTVIAGCAGASRGRSLVTERASRPSGARADAVSQEQAGEPARTVAHAAVEVDAEPAPASDGEFTLDASEDDVQLASMQQDVVSRPVEVHAIDFGTALATVAGQNPRAALAHRRIAEAFANVDAAEVLWLPSLRAGLSYNRHEGQLQEVRGSNLDINRSALNAGLGTRSVGAGTPGVPGLYAQFHLADALFQPEIARNVAHARQHAANATVNDLLLETSLAYLELLAAVQEASIARETQEHAQMLVDLTEAFARTGQGAQADADRAGTELTVRQNQVTRAQERIHVASARLAELLHADAGLHLEPVEPHLVAIDLVDANYPVRELIATGLSTRPELGEASYSVQAACERLRRERYAPLVPSLLLGASYSGFGAGVGDSIVDFNDRTDFDAAAWWEIRNLGFGESAARDSARARMEQAQFHQMRLMDQVAREVVEAQTQVEHRKSQIAVAAAGVEAAQNSYRRNHERIREAQGLPIEVLQAIDALDRARREYLRTVVQYNEAQFRLQRALGWPIPGSEM